MLQTQHPQVVQTQFHYLEFSVNLIEQICICQLFGKLPPTKIPSSKIIEGERLGDFLRKVVLHSVIFTECFFLLYNRTYDSEKKGKSGCWCKPQMRDWLYCRIGYGHGSAPCNCIRDIQLLPIRIRISVCFCLRIIIVMLIFHVAFPHQRKSVSSSASTDAEAQQGGNQCLFVEGLQQVH